MGMPSALHLEPAPQSTVSIRVVQGLADVLAVSGIDRQTFLAEARISSALLADEDARISRLEMFRLCEVAIDLTGDSALGLH
jgi:hypothetical protein